jgi:AcrR family transcriptional regulator
VSKRETTKKKPVKNSTANASPNGQSSTRRELVEAQLLEHAAVLFADKGVGATSLEDVAASMGMRRPSLYHYVSSKDDLLERIVGNFAEGGEAVVLEVARQDWDAPTKLRAIARGLCLEVASGPSRFRLVLNSEANLPAALAARIRASKRVVTREITTVVADGTRLGDFRPVDPTLAALGVLGMCNWIAWWYKPGPAHPPEPVADSIAEQAVRSVMRHEGQELHSGDPRVVLDALRANVATLDGLLARRAPTD